MKADIADIRLSATLFDQAFRIKGADTNPWAMINLRAIHWHATYEIFFILKGKLRVITEDEVREYSDTAVIIPPHFHHYVLPENVAGYCMYFMPEQNPRKNDGLYRSVCELLGDEVTAVPLNEELAFYIARLDLCTADSSLWENAEALNKLLFSSLFHSLVPQQSHALPLSSKHTQYINTIDLYISKNYNRPIRLESLAAELFLCRKQVTRVIRREYGCSLSDLVNRRRLSVACMLLKHTSLDIGEIATTVGYDHENYFYTLFRKTYGVTPGQYREEKRDGPKESERP